MRYTTVVFDFDGTIADTQHYLFEIVNELAPDFGFVPISRDEIPGLRKMSGREILVKRLQIPLWNFVKIFRLERKGRAIFERRAQEIRVFPGIAELIGKIQHAGIGVGIVTSNTHQVVAKTLMSAGIHVDFVHAGSSFLKKDAAIMHALAPQKIDPTTVLYIGDELRDVEACKKIGIAMIGVAWGYNDADALREVVEVAENADDLQKKILGRQ